MKAISMTSERDRLPRILVDGWLWCMATSSVSRWSRGRVDNAYLPCLRYVPCTSDPSMASGLHEESRNFVAEMGSGGGWEAGNNTLFAMLPALPIPPIHAVLGGGSPPIAGLVGTPAPQPSAQQVPMYTSTSNTIVLLCSCAQRFPVFPPTPVDSSANPPPPTPRRTGHLFRPCAWGQALMQGCVVPTATVSHTAAPSHTVASSLM